MTEVQTPTEVATAYLKAFAAKDMTAARQYLADDIGFESPRVKLTGAEAVLEAVGQFAEFVTDVTIATTIGDDEQAIVLYDMHTGPFGTLRVADHYVVRDGKIVDNRIVFDTYQIRQAEAG